MKCQLEDLTYVEFRERLADNPLIIVPLGSQEEQGPSAPMGDAPRGATQVPASLGGGS